MEYIDHGEISYVICPGVYSNLGRFISGVNNSKHNNHQKNVESIKFRIGLQIHVVLYTKRKIDVGETLYYDYNNYKIRGILYDTSHFS